MMSAVNKRRLGSSELEITAIGVGAFAIGGWMWGGQEDRESEAAIRAALDAGVNWIDTAPIYGEGKASRVVGRVLRQIPTSQRPLVFTKFGHHFIDGQRITSGASGQVLRDCDEELERLGVDCLDLFQLHWPAPEPIEETACACARLLAAGKIRAIGVSNFSAAQLEAWRSTGVPLHSVQNGFSIVRPEPSLEVLPWCIEHQVGLLAYSPLFRGLLSGTWTPDKTFPPGDHRGERDDFRGEHLYRWLDAVDALRKLGRDSGLSVAQLAVSRLLAYRGTAGIIVGARRADQGMALGCMAVDLEASQISAIDAIVERCKADLSPKDYR